MGSFGIDWFWSSADSPIPGDNVTYRSTPLKDTQLIIELVKTIGKHYSWQTVFELVNDEKTQDGWHTAVTQALLDLKFATFAVAFCDEYNNVEAADSAFVGDIFIDRRQLELLDGWPRAYDESSHPRRYHQLRFVVWSGEEAAGVEVIENAAGELPIPGQEYPAIHPNPDFEEKDMAQGMSEARRKLVEAMSNK
jgi:hypothetical protein